MTGICARCNRPVDDHWRNECPPRNGPLVDQPDRHGLGTPIKAKD